MTARDDAEEMRVRYRYRRLILQRQARVSLEVAKRLIGPDCAYHLYAGIGAGASQSEPVELAIEDEHERDPSPTGAADAE